MDYYTLHIYGVFCVSCALSITKSCEYIVPSPQKFNPSVKPADTCWGCRKPLLELVNKPGKG